MSDEVDHILSSDDGLEPSSGFAHAVMNAVRREAAEPPPLPFPWRWFIVGVAACLSAAASGAALWSRAEPALLALAAPLAPLASVAPELGYAAMALIASAGLARLPRALARP
jgi:hypothetical protein